MKVSSTVVGLGIVSSALAETIHGVVVFSRHGDRTSKFYPGYVLTNLGAEQLYSSGQYYRNRYIVDDAPNKIFNISSTKVNPSQIWASAPDQSVLMQTALDYLQGLYPPLSTLNTPLASMNLNNGSKVEAPLGGYQFVQIHGETTNDPDTIWLKGADGCPAFTSASNSYKNSTEFIDTFQSTKDFYSQFVPQLGNILGQNNVTYAHAYEVFDLFNTGLIQNATLKDNITSSQLDQLRYLANQHEWALNYNATSPDRAIGGMTFAGGVLRQLNQTVTGKAKLKFSLMTGSYDTFLSVFGLTNLTADTPNFFGLPNYASSMAFELFTEANMTTFPNTTDDLRVRFLFRNGTGSDAELTPFPLFGQPDTSLSYTDFVANFTALAITSAGQWCSRCQSTDIFCAAATNSAASTPSDSSSGSSGLTVAQAGVVGAMVTLAVFLICGLLFWILHRRRTPAGAGRKGSGSGSESKMSA